MMVDNGGKSASGLHYVTVAPRIDKSGEIVRDENGAVKYDVYSFNRDKIYALEKYNMAKFEKDLDSHIQTVVKLGFLKEIWNGNNDTRYMIHRIIKEKVTLDDLDLFRQKTEEYAGTR